MKLVLFDNISVISGTLAFIPTIKIVRVHTRIAIVIAVAALDTSIAPNIVKTRSTTPIINTATK